MDWIHQLAPATALDDLAPAPRRLANVLELTELILPQQANHYGTLFGPNALALLGKAAFLVAARYTRQPVVMAAAREIEFVAPVPVGALLVVRARVTRVGRTSMTVQVAAAFDTAPGIRADDVLRGDFEMVAVDDLGRPTPVRAAGGVAVDAVAAPAA